jgi:hypothetical protein
MIEFYDRPQRVVPVLFLAAANRQGMIEAKADIGCQNRTSAWKRSISHFFLKAD